MNKNTELGDPKGKNVFGFGRGEKKKRNAPTAEQLAWEEQRTDLNSLVAERNRQLTEVFSALGEAFLEKGLLVQKGENIQDDIDAIRGQVDGVKYVMNFSTGRERDHVKNTPKKSKANIAIKFWPSQSIDGIYVEPFNINVEVIGEIVIGSFIPKHDIEVHELKGGKQEYNYFGAYQNSDDERAYKDEELAEKRRKLFQYLTDKLWSIVGDIQNTSAEELRASYPF